MLPYIFVENNKLYDKSNFELPVNHIQQVCCTVSSTDKERFMLDKAFSLRNSLSETEESTLYYISNYVPLKENIAVVELTDTTKYFSSSEFTILLSRGKSSHPPPEIFELTYVFYCY